MARRNCMDQNRRTLLKFLLVGAGAFALGKIFGPGIGLFGARRKKEVIREADFQNFRVVETKNELTFYGKKNEEILIVDKGAF